MKKNIIQNYWDTHYKNWWEWNRWSKLSSDLRFFYELKFLKIQIKKNKLSWNYLEIWFWNWKFFKEICKDFDKSIWIEISNIALDKVKKELNDEKIELKNISILDIDTEKYKNYFDFIFMWWVLMFNNEEEIEAISSILHKILKKDWVCIFREFLSNKEIIINKKEDYIEYLHSVSFLKDSFNKYWFENTFTINHIFWFCRMKKLEIIKNLKLLFLIIRILFVLSFIKKSVKSNSLEHYFIIIKKIWN